MYTCIGYRWEISQRPILMFIKKRSFFELFTLEWMWNFGLPFANVSHTRIHMCTKWTHVSVCVACVCGLLLYRGGVWFEKAL